jgi:hypothetical protein
MVKRRHSRIGQILVVVIVLLILLLGCTSQAVPTATVKTTPEQAQSTTIPTRTDIIPSPTAQTQESELETSVEQSVSIASSRIPWSQVRYFDRADSDIAYSEDLGDDDKRISLSNLDSVEELPGFQLMVGEALLRDYVFDEGWYKPETGAVHLCYEGALNVRNGSVSRVCIVQQETRFEYKVGHSAEVFSAKIEDLYFEYLFGGWLKIGSDEELGRKYQWDRRMVPLVIFRYFVNGYYIEVAGIEACGDKNCIELMALAYPFD